MIQGISCPQIWQAARLSAPVPAEVDGIGNGQSCFPRKDFKIIDGNGIRGAVFFPWMGKDLADRERSSPQSMPSISPITVIDKPHCKIVGNAQGIADTLAGVGKFLHRPGENNPVKVSAGKLIKAGFSLTVIDGDAPPNTGQDLVEAVVDPDDLCLTGANQVLKKKPSPAPDIEDALALANPVRDDLEICFAFYVQALHVRSGGEKGFNKLVELRIVNKKAVVAKRRAQLGIRSVLATP